MHRSFGPAWTNGLVGSTWPAVSASASGSHHLEEGSWTTLEVHSPCGVGLRWAHDLGPQKQNMLYIDLSTEF